MKILISVILFWLLVSPTVSATLNDDSSWIEEALCFNVLNEAVANDNRFRDNVVLPNNDLTSVLLEEVSDSYEDLSHYNNFWWEAEYNPSNSGGNTDDDYLFDARRNNIGTIIAGNNYLYSQIVGFWRESNFDFPLSAPIWQPSYGDKYVLGGNFFKEYILYTHHVKSNFEDNPLMSCGIVKVTPLGGRTFSEINEGWYLTNILTGITNQANLWWQKCNSGFEWEYKSLGWEDFYQMKSRVCAIHYDESDLLALDVISVAYDNDSTRLNEYYTHPLQVEAMRNNSNHADGLKGIQDVFMQKLFNETCYRVVHWNGIWSLPAHCWWSYGPISYSSQNFSLWDILFPSVFAQREELGGINQEEEEQAWMMVQWNLPYTLYQKLQEIPDENFRDYMLLSILPNFDDVIAHKEESNVLLTPFEEVFLACDLDYSQRFSIVEDFLNNLELVDFSLSNLQYNNDRYGDCIIPYPDADKLSVVVEDSFESNQILAEQLSWSYQWPEVSQEINEYISQRQIYIDDLNTKLWEIESQFNRWEISFEDWNNLKIQEEEKTYNQLEELTKNFQNTSEIDELIQNNIVDNTEKMNIKSILLFLLFIIMGASLIGFAIYKNKKK